MSASYAIPLTFLRAHLGGSRDPESSRGTGQSAADLCGTGRVETIQGKSRTRSVADLHIPHTLAARYDPGPGRDSDRPRLDVIPIVPGRTLAAIASSDAGGPDLPTRTERSSPTPDTVTYAALTLRNEECRHHRQPYEQETNHARRLPQPQGVRIYLRLFPPSH